METKPSRVPATQEELTNKIISLSKQLDIDEIDLKDLPDLSIDTLEKFFIFFEREVKNKQKKKTVRADRYE